MGKIEKIKNVKIIPELKPNFKLRNLGNLYKEIVSERSKDVRLVLIGSEGTEIENLRKLLYQGSPREGNSVYTITTRNNSLSQDDLERIKKSNLILFFFEATREPSASDLEIFNQVKKTGVPLYVLLSKINSIPNVDFLRGNLSLLLRVSREEIVPIDLKNDKMVRKRLAPRVIQTLNNLEIPLGTKIPYFRKIVADRIIQKISIENGLIGLAVIIPGVDMPALTLNQIRMVLRIAALYEKDLSIKRLKEILTVLGSGFIFRTVARELLDFVPGPGWLIKGSVAYSGTLALGRAAIKYFERMND